MNCSSLTELEGGVIGIFLLVNAIFLARKQLSKLTYQLFGPQNTGFSGI